MQAYFNALTQSTRRFNTLLRPVYATASTSAVSSCRSRCYATNTNTNTSVATDDAVPSWEKWKILEGAFSNANPTSSSTATSTSSSPTMTYESLMSENISSSYVRSSGRRDAHLNQARRLSVEEIWRQRSEQSHTMGVPAKTYDGAVFTVLLPFAPSFPC